MADEVALYAPQLVLSPLLVFAWRDAEDAGDRACLLELAVFEHECRHGVAVEAEDAPDQDAVKAVREVDATVGRSRLLKQQNGYKRVGAARYPV